MLRHHKYFCSLHNSFLANYIQATVILGTVISNAYAQFCGKTKLLNTLSQYGTRTILIGHNFKKEFVFFRRWLCQTGGDVKTSRKGSNYLRLDNRQFHTQKPATYRIQGPDGFATGLLVLYSYVCNTTIQALGNS